MMIKNRSPLASTAIETQNGDVAGIIITARIPLRMVYRRDLPEPVKVGHCHHHTRVSSAMCHVGSSNHVIQRARSNFFFGIELSEVDDTANCKKLAKQKRSVSYKTDFCVLLLPGSFCVPTSTSWYTIIIIIVRLTSSILLLRARGYADAVIANANRDVVPRLKRHAIGAVSLCLMRHANLTQTTDLFYSPFTEQIPCNVMHIDQKLIKIKRFL